MTTRQNPARNAAADIPFPLPQVQSNEKRRARRLLAALEQHYPDAACALTYTSPHELLIATILSAQCTDVAVNKATPALFERFPHPTDYAASSPPQIEPYVHSLGFFRNKSKAIHSAMTNIVERFEGRVPRTMDELLSLQGVARKTANVVLGNAFAVNVGFVVDTHIQRLSRRLCLIDDGQSVQMIERKLMALFPRTRWTALSHMLIHHGRNACSARAKHCADHPICKGFGRCCERPRTHQS
ncbi:MAG: endonuclease III [Planctomycetes bacterium]|nr:endonuclease III [Planctomycetota bacterium]